VSSGWRHPTPTDDDPANYLGALGAIDVEKFVNDDDADDPPGPLIPVGDPVTWTYVVRSGRTRPRSARRRRGGSTTSGR
jgi:hypothetical protein